MKRIRSLVLAVILSLSLVCPAYAEASAETEAHVNYMSIMLQSAVKGDYESGVAAQNARNSKIDRLGLNYQKVAFEDLFLLAKIIYAEAGSAWLSDEWKMAVGEVVLNRVASSEFPNTVKAVIYQRGQYYGSSSSYFNRLLPDRRCVLLAKRLLEGERHLEPSVVFQANFRQGSGVYAAYYDKTLGWTYFCFSSRRSLYAA